MNYLYDAMGRRVVALYPDEATGLLSSDSYVMTYDGFAPVQKRSMLDNIIFGWCGMCRDEFAELVARKYYCTHIKRMCDIIIWQSLTV